VSPFPREDLRGVVFDLDGTLILNRHDFPRMQNAIVELAGRAGAPREGLVVTEPIGTSQILARTREQLAQVGCSAENLRTFERDVAIELGRIELEAVPRLALRPGAADLLTELTSRGLRLGLFTRGSGPFCDEVLRRLHLEGTFSGIRTRSAPGPAKPSPEALLQLLQSMHLAPREALYIGDQPEDARCAARAKVAFWAVLPDPSAPSDLTREQFLALGASEVAENLEGIRTLFGPPANPSSSPSPRA
jgi:phosphoglycolate phosphatase-like HAD superfamily hydrolase